jgi:hypothetical protein
MSCLHCSPLRRTERPAVPPAGPPVILPRPSGAVNPPAGPPIRTRHERRPPIGGTGDGPGTPRAPPAARATPSRPRRARAGRRRSEPSAQSRSTNTAAVTPETIVQRSCAKPPLLIVRSGRLAGRRRCARIHENAGSADERGRVSAAGWRPLSSGRGRVRRQRKCAAAHERTDGSLLGRGPLLEPIEDRPQILSLAPGPRIVDAEGLKVRPLSTEVVAADVPAPRAGRDKRSRRRVPPGRSRRSRNRPRTGPGQARRCRNRPRVRDSAQAARLQHKPLQRHDPIMARPGDDRLRACSRRCGGAAGRCRCSHRRQGALPRCAPLLVHSGRLASPHWRARFH